MVGKGLAMWPDVNIEDGENIYLIYFASPQYILILSVAVGDLYMTIFDAATKNPSKASHGREGFYFAENGEHTWYSISKEISRVLVQKGIGHNVEPTTFIADELVKYWGSEVASFRYAWFRLVFLIRPRFLQDAGNGYGSNSRCRANRSRLLGWRPVRTKDDMIASIEAEVEAVVLSHRS